MHHKKRLYRAGLLLLAVFVTWIAQKPDWVEYYYTYGFYPVLARMLRFLFGWIPVSLGDILYALLLIYFSYHIIRFVLKVGYRLLAPAVIFSAFTRFFFFSVLAYILYMVFWGLNYGRLGISHQLKLEKTDYTVADLDTLAMALQKKLNHYAMFVTPAQRDSFDKKKFLFREARNGYRQAANTFPYLQYRTTSIKPSLFSYIENYLGFLGYYNPFTGEAVVNTLMPKMLEPFVTAHEIAHQIGYARENEANFVAYLAGSHSGSNVLCYSTYFYMYNYTIGELNAEDSVRAAGYEETLHPQCQIDYAEVRTFYKLNRNSTQRIISLVYDRFLRLNRQPGGRRSYNQVVIWLVAYYKKYGIEAL
jgi:hypothetical protein